MQKKRLADAERVLKSKATKKAQDDQRIATNKIAWAKGKLDDLRRTQLKDKDSRTVNCLASRWPQPRPNVWDYL